MESVAMRWRSDALLSDEKKQKLEAFLQPLVLSEKTLERIMSVMEIQIKLANSPDRATREKSELLMSNTYVRCLLDGKENGTYLGLDLGGSNFRVVKVALTNGEAETAIRYYKLTDELRSGPSDRIFEHIAVSIKYFLEKENISGTKEKIPLGFSFSFPTEQYSLTRSTLLTWAKTFKNPDGPGRDPVQMLEEAIQRKTPDLPVDVVAIVNDATSTLMAGNYLDKMCRVGLILGTGFNIAYVEHVKNIEKWTGDDRDPQNVVVNVGDSFLGDKGSLDFYRSEFEKEVDEFSNHPHSITFEKSFSGLYLGELVRLILLKMISKKLLLGGTTSPEIMKRWNLTTTDVSMIVRDENDEAKNTREVLKKMKLDDKASDEDVAIIQHVTHFMSQRGAFLVASNLAVCIRHINLPEVTVAVDGSEYQYHPTFHTHITYLLKTLVPETKVKMIFVKDGSGQGAAFVAVAALRQRQLGLVSA